MSVSPNRVGPGTVTAAAALRSELAAHAASSDRGRALDPASVAAMRSSGLLRMLTHPDHGGESASLVEIVDAVAGAAAGDGSAGWLAMIFACSDAVVGLFDARARTEVYAGGPDTAVCAVFAPSATAHQVPGGWELEGRWAPSSGCHLAGWALLGFPAEAGERALALVPITELEIRPTWDTLGVRATASDTLVGSGLRVPEHRVLRLGPALAGQGRDRHARALTPVLTTMLIAPFVGMATAALDLVVGEARDRGVAFTTHPVRAESTGFQIQVAGAAARIDSATALAQRAARDIDAHTDGGTHPEPAERARFRGWAGHAVAECRTAVDVLASAHGASGFGADSPLARIVRDVQTASRHAMANPAANAEVYGRALLDVEPSISPLL